MKKVINLDVICQGFSESWDSTNFCCHKIWWWCEKENSADLFHHCAVWNWIKSFKILAISSFLL